MSFEDSPRFRGKHMVSRPRRLASWVSRHFPWLLMVTFALFGLDVLLACRYIYPTAFSNEPGGLEGCLVSTDGRPLQASVVANEVTRIPYEDGCFFFADLPPGEQTITIQASSGQALTQKVDIVPGQMVSLGQVRVP